RNNPPPAVVGGPVVIAGNGNNNNAAPKGGPAGQVQLRQGPATRIQLVNGQVQVGSQITFQDPFDPKDRKFRCKLFSIDLQAGRNYTIDMVSPNPQALDPYLRIEDMNGNVLAEDDDNGGNLNARIIFRPAVSGPFVIVATTFDAN